jgi:hypothetical protein
MSRAFDLSQVVQFVPTSNLCGVDAIVCHPDDTMRVATESMCVSFGGKEKVEFILAALEYYRKHVMIHAEPGQVGGWLQLPKH